jgi:hypothetical protein
MPDMMDDFMEQLDAARAIIHHYTCFKCGQFEGYEPVVVGVEDEEGLRVIVLAACITCAKEVPSVTTAQSPTQTKGI